MGGDETENEESGDESEESGDESEESGDESESEESEVESEDEESGEEKETNQLNLKNITQEAKIALLDRQKKDLSHLVYNDGHDNNDDAFNNTNDDDLFTVSEKAFDTKRSITYHYDCCDSFGEKTNLEKYESLYDWTMEEERLKMQDVYVTGNWKQDEDAKTLLDQDDALFGDFKDLESSNSKEDVDSGCVDSEDKSDAESVS